MYLTICNAEGRVVNLNLNDCVERCGNSETNMSGMCKCASDATMDLASIDRKEKGTWTCIAKEACADYLMDNGVYKYCVTEEHCKNT